MAYGKGKSKELMKRMADLGTLPLSAEFSDLRARMIDTLAEMAKAVWPEDFLSPVLSGKEMDPILLKVQSAASKNGLNNVWAEKARFIAKAAVAEQWKRGQRNLFGKFRHAATVGDVVAEDGTTRFVNFSEKNSAALSPEDVGEIEELAKGMDFRSTMEFFRKLRTDECGLRLHQAEALRDMCRKVGERFGRPVWKHDAAVQLHVDFRCVRGGRDELNVATGAMSEALSANKGTSATLPLTSVSPRGKVIAVPLKLAKAVSRMHGSPGTGVTSFVLELGPKKVQVKMVVTRPPAVIDPSLARTVVAEDFGFRNTSTLAVVRGPAPIGREALTRVAGHNGEDVDKITKTAARKFLEAHVSGDETEVLERVQFDGKDFLDRIKVQALKIDGLRSRIDLIYNRIGRIRSEINRVAGGPKQDTVPAEAALPDHPRYMAMHGKFFRLLAEVGGLKEKRRAVYRSVTGLKKAWFGYVAARKADLAEKYGAVVVREDLDILAIPKDDPDYKGRTFNRMMNNGSKGQYTRRSDLTLGWRGIASVKIPSYYTSSTDTRTGTVDRKQRRGAVFKAAADGRRSDADMNAAETIGRYLFLMPKAAAEYGAAALAA